MCGVTLGRMQVHTCVPLNFHCVCVSRTHTRSLVGTIEKHLFWVVDRNRIRELSVFAKNCCFLDWKRRRRKNPEASKRFWFLSIFVHPMIYPMGEEVYEWASDSLCWELLTEDFPKFIWRWTNTVPNSNICILVCMIVYVPQLSFWHTTETSVSDERPISGRQCCQSYSANPLERAGFIDL